MTRLLILINRGLYGLLALTALGSGAALLAGLFDSDDAPAARPLPAFTLAPVMSHDPLRLPERNIFDPSGVPWHGKTQAAAQTARQSAPPKGIVRLPGVEGVLTETGFVKPGQMLPEGRLKAVVPGGYVVTAPNGEVTTLLDPDRPARIKTVLSPPPKPPVSGTVK